MNSKKQRLELEYPLNARKPDILWSLMSTDHGLERWIADRVEEKNGILELTWGEIWGEHHTMRANIVERVRIGRSELTEQVCLCVTDYSLPEDIDDLHDLWDGNLERLHQSSGL